MTFCFVIGIYTFFEKYIAFLRKMRYNKLNGFLSNFISKEI